MVKMNKNLVYIQEFRIHFKNEEFEHQLIGDKFILSFKELTNPKLISYNRKIQKPDAKDKSGHTHEKGTYIENGKERIYLRNMDKKTDYDFSYNNLHSSRWYQGRYKKN